MDIHQQVIALLQGELVEPKQISQLLKTVADSADYQRTLIRQIILSRSVSDIRASTLPSHEVDSRILSAAGLLPMEKQTVQGAGNRRGRTAVAVGFLLFLLTGFCLGYLVKPEVQEGRSAGREYSALSVPSEETSPGEAAVPNSIGQSAEAEPTQPSVTPAPEHRGPAGVFSAVERTKRPAKEGVRYISVPEPVSPEEGVKLLSMTGKGKYTMGDVIPVMWEIQGTPSPTTVQYSTNGGATWNTIGRKIEAHQVLWEVPEMQHTVEGLLRVTRHAPSIFATKRSYSFQHDTVLNLAAFSPDGRQLALTDWRGNVLLQDVETGGIRQIFKGHEKPVMEVRFSPDGTRLVSTSLDMTARIWDIGTGKEIFRFNGRGRKPEWAFIWSVTFSPDGERIAVGNDDGSITLYSTGTGDEIRTFAAHREAIRDLWYSPSGNLLLTASTDKRAGVFNADDGSVVRMFTDYDALVNGIAVTNDEKVVVTCDFGGSVKFWDIATGELIRSKKYLGETRLGKLQISSDDQWLAVSGYSGTAKIIDPYSGEVKADLSIGEQAAASGAWPTFSPDSRKLAVITGPFVRIWEIDTRSDKSAAPWVLRPMPSLD